MRVAVRERTRSSDFPAIVYEERVRHHQIRTGSDFWWLSRVLVEFASLTPGQLVRECKSLKMPICGNGVAAVLSELCHKTCREKS